MRRAGARQPKRFPSGTSMGTKDRRLNPLIATAIALGLLASPSVVPRAAGEAARAQEPQEPTYRAGNRTVAVYATVTGPDGRLVPDLPRDAFSILDNGKNQPLT